MDSFELVSQLSNLLTSLNSSKQASVDICNFFIRNYVAQEDLYPTILQVLPKLDINRRLNILQFIDDFVTMIMKDSKYKDNDIIFNYVFLIMSDLHKILQYVLPNYPQLNLSENDENAGKQMKMNIRVLANLPFCFKIVLHISKLFNMEQQKEFESQYESNLLTSEDLENVKKGILFDASILYTEIEPTKTSHVDDYLNSTPETQAVLTEENYIPQKINQGLVNAWKFLIQKRKQSQYESLLIDEVDDPFNLKSQEKQELPDAVSDTPKLDSVKTPFKTPAKTPAKQHVLSSSQPLSSGESDSPKSSHILALSHSLILQRIEADRERQKRGKETLWEIERKSGKIDMSEFEYVYETTQSLDPMEEKLVTEEMESLYELCTMNQKTSQKPKEQVKPDTSARPKSNKPGKHNSQYNDKGGNRNNYRNYEKEDLFYGQQMGKRPRYDEYYNESADWYPSSNRTHNNYRNNNRRQRK